MKNKTVIFSLLSAAILAVGCNQDQSTPQQLDKVKSETKEAAMDMKDFSYAQKAEFVKQMDHQLAALNADLDKLSDKVEKSSDAVKMEARPKVQALREQAGRLNKQLDDARNATESTWDSVKTGFKNGYDALADGFQQARKWVSDKIAP
jgi:ElaB/YqjD/DUF883 family membrane-anchored ribosome-binding protein